MDSDKPHGLRHKCPLHVAIQSLLLAAQREKAFEKIEENGEN